MMAANAGIAQLGDGFQPSWSLCLKTLLCIEPAGYAEILRMYFILFLMLPVVFWALLKNRFIYAIIISSGSLWFAASRGYGMVAFPQLGYFDIVSWQILFIAGICFGFISVREGNELKIPNACTAISFPVAIVFLFVRHWHLFTGHPWPPYFEWLSTWRRTLPLGRLLNFTTFSVLVYHFRSRIVTLAGTVFGRTIAFLGQHSLQVFMWSVFMSMVMSKYDHRWALASSLDRVIVTVLIVASCFIPAWLHRQWKILHREMLGYPSVRPSTVPS